MKDDEKIDPKESQHGGEGQKEETDAGEGITGYYCWNCNIWVPAVEKHICWR